MAREEVTPEEAKRILRDKPAKGHERQLDVTLDEAKRIIKNDPQTTKE